MSEKVNIKKTETIADQKNTLKKVTFDYQKKNGDWQTKTNELYDMGDATSVLLYNKEQKKVILTRQFRLPTYMNGNKSGMLIETCAGKLGDESPEEGIKREILEETGFKIDTVQKVMEVYTTPGTVTELLYLFVAAYTDDMKTAEGGGLEEEQEEVQVMELPFEEAMNMMKNGEIKDAKTVILLQYAALMQLL